MAASYLHRCRQRGEDSVHTPWGGGEQIPNTPFRRVIPADATENRMVMLAVDMPVGEDVGAHVHEREDQVIVVVSGTVGATVGEEEFELTAGSVVFLPRGIPHAQWNKGDDVARVLEIYTPGGFDLVFERVGAIVASGRQPTPDDFRRVDEERARS
jgi:mannose-6-phosphate isomerase-like protein (cupin superfamily)